MTLTAATHASRSVQSQAKVLTSRPRAKDTAVSTTMATNGDGTAVVSLGSK